jgi:photosystem II stability/assembly factor-like uncharacterized protein
VTAGQRAGGGRKRLLLLSLIMACVMPGGDSGAQPHARFRRLQGMRTRLLVLAAASLVAAGCGTGTLQSAGGQSTSPAVGGGTAAASTSAAAPASSAPAGAAGTSTPATGAAAGSGTASTACAGVQAAPVEAGSLTGLEFVSAGQGWAVGQDTILATTDGGAHWTPQLAGKLNLTSVDFISGRDGWAVGTTSLLATTDGGAHWTALPEPCPVIRSVHFVSPSAGYAVAGGTNVSGNGSGMPVSGGVVLTTSDGGHSWHTLATPANAQSVCFSDPQHGWLGAAGLLYRTTDGGTDWTVMTSMSGQAGSGADLASMSVECASDASAWAMRIGPGAAMSQDPHVGFHADQAGATPIFAEQYFQTPGGKPVAESPGSDAGPFSAIDAASAVFVDWCSACGPGTAPWDIATNSGATLTKKGNVGSITQPQAASFLSPEVGWVAGSESVFPTSATGTPKSQERIVATTDGGRTWHVQYAGPWNS